MTRPRDAQEFIDWEERQDERFELVDGATRLMTGGTEDHAAIAANVIRALGNRLAGSPCRVRTGDLKIVVDANNVFYPDALVVCGPRNAHATWIDDPVVAVEVTSPSSVSIDHARKATAHRRLASLKHYVIISHAEPTVVVWTRGETEWTDVVVSFEGEGNVMLTQLGLSLTLTEIYDGTSQGPILAARGAR